MSFYWTGNSCNGTFIFQKIPYNMNTFFISLIEIKLDWKFVSQSFLMRQGCKPVGLIIIFIYKEVISPYLFSHLRISAKSLTQAYWRILWQKDFFFTLLVITFFVCAAVSPVTADDVGPVEPLTPIPSAETGEIVDEIRSCGLWN